MLNLLNSSHAEIQIIYSLQKGIKELEENSFLVLNYFNKSSSLISTFKWPFDYRNRENYCKRPWFTYACTSQRVKHWLFYSKYRIKVGKLKCFKIKKGGSKMFQKGHSRILRCLNISNSVITKVVKFIKYKPNGGSNHLSSVESIKIEK